MRRFAFRLCLLLWLIVPTTAQTPGPQPGKTANSGISTSVTPITIEPVTPSSEINLRPLVPLPTLPEATPTPSPQVAPGLDGTLFA